MIDRLTEAELAERCRVKVRTVQKWRREKTGPAYLKTGGVRYLIVDVEAWEKSRRVTTKEAA